MYGPGVQARQLLIARRLIERGVRFIQLFHGDVQPWDSHDNIAGAHRALGQQCDQAIAALLTDLKQRGLFEETLILCGGEFGRTPAVELVGGKPGMGRDHNHWGFSVWLAGGGVKGGHIHGATDEFGYRAVDNPVHVHDLHATILHLLGFDHTKLTYRYAGRDFRLTDVEGEVVRDILACLAETASSRGRFKESRPQGLISILHRPLQQVQRHRPERQQLVVKSAEVEGQASFLLGPLPQFPDLQLADLVCECLTRPGDVAVSLDLDLVPRPRGVLLHVIDGPGAGAAFVVHAGVSHQAGAA
jgi:hypothetical protein